MENLTNYDFLDGLAERCYNGLCEAVPAGSSAGKVALAVTEVLAYLIASSDDPRGVLVHTQMLLSASVSGRVDCAGRLN